MFDFIIVYLVIISIFIALVFPILLLVLRIMDATQSKVTLTRWLRIVFLPFSIGYQPWQSNQNHIKKLYLVWLNIGFILSLISLLYLLASAR
jgi:hypothetical protein